MLIKTIDIRGYVLALRGDGAKRTVITKNDEVCPSRFSSKNSLSHLWKKSTQTLGGELFKLVSLSRKITDYRPGE
jgi:hypothetical protein